MHLWLGTVTHTHTMSVHVAVLVHSGPVRQDTALALQNLSRSLKGGVTVVYGAGLQNLSADELVARVMLLQLQNPAVPFSHFLVVRHDYVFSVGLVVELVLDGVPRIYTSTCPTSSVPAYSVDHLHKTELTELLKQPGHVDLAEVLQDPEAGVRGGVVRGMGGTRLLPVTKLCPDFVLVHGAFYKALRAAYKGILANQGDQWVSALTAEKSVGSLRMSPLLAQLKLLNESPGPYMPLAGVASAGCFVCGKPAVSLTEMGEYVAALGVAGAVDKSGGGGGGGTGSDGGESKETAVPSSPTKLAEAAQKRGDDARTGGAAASGTSTGIGVAPPAPPPPQNTAPPLSPISEGSKTDSDEGEAQPQSQPQGHGGEIAGQEHETNTDPEDNVLGLLLDEAVITKALKAARAACLDALSTVDGAARVRTAMQTLSMALLDTDVFEEPELE
jgi:hypothetical protein